MIFICNKNMWRMYFQPWLITSLKLASSDYYWHVFFQKKKILSSWLKQAHSCCITCSDEGHCKCIEQPVLRTTHLLRGQGGCSVFAGAEPQVNTISKSSPRGHYRALTIQHSCMPLLRGSHNRGETHPLNLGWIKTGLDLVSVPSMNQQVI